MFLPIPIRFHDGRDFHAIPVVNGLLVVLNVLIFFLGYGPELGVGRGSGVLSIVTHAFGHVGAWHLIGNMWALLVFGTPVNRRLGNGWYRLFRHGPGDRSVWLVVLLRPNGRGFGSGFR